MQQVKRILKMNIGVMLLGVIALLNSANAAAGSIYDTCIANSGGRGAISSVQWACGKYEDSGGVENDCSLWIGDSWSSVVPIIYVRSLTEVHTVYYYGMCTGFSNTTAAVWVDNDGGAIDDSSQVTRGPWANPGSKAANLYVSNFVQGISSTEVYVSNPPAGFPVGTYDEYKRTVTIGRCHGGNASSCSSQNEVVTVRIPKNTNKLTINHVAHDCYGNTTTIRSETIDPDENGYAIAQPMNSGGYVFTGWEPASAVGAGGRVDLSQGAVTLTANYDNTNVVCISDSECAAWAPASYLNSSASQGETSVIIGVKNHSVGNQNSQWSHLTNTGPLRNATVYAKPTDKIEWKYCYYPGVQKTANSTVTVNNEHSEPSDSCSTSLNNKKFSEAYSWDNWYEVQSTNLKASSENIHKRESFAAGDSSVKSGSNDYLTKPSSVYGGSLLDPGSTLDERIWTGGPLQTSVTADGTHSWVCGYTSCSCGENCITQCPVYGHHSSTFYQNSHSGSSTSDHAEVKIPYNFITTATAQITNSLLYSGETANISATATTVTVNPRSNNETQGNYATDIPGAKVRLMAYLSASDSGSEQRGVGNESEGENNGLCAHLPYKNGRCNELSRDDQTLNPDSIAAGNTIRPSYAGQTYNVYDEAAGNYYCVVAAVWPYTVKDDRDMDQSGNGTWYISAPSCVVIAKRPTFQVWGAGVYSAGDITTSVSIKNNVKDFEAWTPQGGRDTLFGSWGELAVTAEGIVNKFASGASTGYRGGLPSSPFAAFRTSYYGMGNPGGLQGDLGHFCVRSPLTIGNFYCNSVAGNFTQIDAVREGIQSDKAALLSRFGDEVRDESVIGATQLTRGETRVNVHNGDIQITGNITFPNDSYTGLNDIPKYIIYAKGGNINIDCSVTQIDAVLIADNNVNTCNNDNTNSGARSHQLVIKGAVVTGSLTLNRSFGANVGGNSIVPAELFNYDSSLYLWAHRMAEGSNSGTLTEVTTRELPPRY